MNSTIHKRDDSSPMTKRVMPTSYSSSSFFTNYNAVEGETTEKQRESMKTNDKSSDSDPVYGKRLKPSSMQIGKSINEDEVIHTKSDSEGRMTSIYLNKFNTQEALNSFTPEQRELVKILMSKVLLEKKQRADGDEQNPSTQDEIQLSESK